MKLLVKLFTKTVTILDIWFGGNRLDFYMSPLQETDRVFEIIIIICRHHI